MTNVNNFLTEIDDHIIETFSLRSGNTLVCTDDALYVVRDGDDTIRISRNNIAEVQYDDFDWFLGFVSLALIGFGFYSTSRDVLLGLGFAGAGIVSFYLTYRKRSKISVRVAGRPKPLGVYPESGQTTYEALGSWIESKEQG